MQAEAELKRKAKARLDWQKMLAAAPVDLSGLPRGVAEHALRVIERIRTGVGFNEVRGKRLTKSGMRDVIRIPLRQEYRMVLRERGGRIEFLEVLSHESYNSKLAGKAWR